MLGYAHSGHADLDSVEDDGLEVVPRVAGAELARVGMHCECHGGLNPQVQRIRFGRYCKILLGAKL